VNATNLFLLDNQHQQVLDGNNNALKKPHLSTILFVVPILIIVAIYALGIAAGIVIHAIELNTFGIAAKGIITDKKHEGIGTNHHVYRAFYSFVANDNHTYAENTAIDGSDFSSLNIGDPVIVKYSDGNPNDTRLDNYNPEERRAIVSWLAGGLPCLGFALLGFITANTRLRRWQRLIRSGQIIEGKVSSVDYITGAIFSGPYGYSVMRYEFDSPSGRLIRGKVKLNYERRYSQITGGTPLAVFYIHDHLYQVL
jgi:hypothetical protein